MVVYLIFFNKPKKSMRPFELILISITNNPEGIKNGKYREVPNSKLFGPNPNIKICKIYKLLYLLYISLYNKFITSSTIL